MDAAFAPTTIPASAASGATAQTSGFTQAGLPPSEHATGPSTNTTTSTSAAASGGGMSALASQFGYLATDSTAGFGGGGGGLGSSPNVPRPGTSIDPATGKPHTAGLTRAELAELKAKAAGLADPTPQTEQARRSSFYKSQFGVMASEEAVEGERQRRASAGSVGSASGKTGGLSGREQAAKQLVGGGEGLTASKIPESGMSTPFQELPGGWGPVKQTGLPGSGPNAPTSIYEDVTDGLQKVGTAAFNLMPNSVREALHNQGTKDPNAPSPVSTGTRRLSTTASGLLEQAKVRAEKFADTFEHKVLGEPPAYRSYNASLVDATPQPTGTTAATSGPRSSLNLEERGTQVVNTVEGFLGEVLGSASLAGEKYAETVGGLAAPKKDLPSEEPLGAKPGEKSSGVGALPGPSTETGVAVLPDEKKIPTYENQGMLPGEVPPAAIAASSTTEPSASHSAPDPAPAASSRELTTEQPSLSSAGGATIATVPETGTAPARDVAASEAEAAPAASSSVSSDATPRSQSSGAYTGLAAALPATALFTGAAHGATDLHTTAGATVDQPTADVPNPAPAATSSLAEVPKPGPAGASSLSTPPVNDRTTSMASVTAIHHGHEGHRPIGNSPLKMQSITPEEVPTGAGHGKDATSAGASAAALEASAPAAAAAAGEPGVSQAKSLTPGKEEHGVGHPSTSHVEGNTREPGSYPKADHDGTAESAVPAPASTEKSAPPATTAAAIQPSATAVETPSSSAPKNSLATSSHPAHGTDATATPSISASNNTATNGPSSPSATKTVPVNTSTHNDKGHARTGSAASSGSNGNGNGKKRLSFMSKLKAKMSGDDKHH